MLFLPELTFNSIASPLIVNANLIFCGDEFRVILGSSKTWATQANAIPLAESTIGACEVDLVRTHNH